MTQTLLRIATWIGQAMNLRLSTLRRPLAAELAAIRMDNDRLRAENELLRTQLRRLDPARRPRFKPWERLAILWHRARYGLSLESTAKSFVLSVKTVAAWAKAVEDGVRRLVSTREPLNKLPDLVRELVGFLRFEWPRWGTRRVAGALARMGVKASRKTVQRLVRRGPPRPAKRMKSSRSGALVAKQPGHIWIADFTRLKSIFRTVVGGAVIDAFSRKVLALRVWSGGPSAVATCGLVASAIREHGRPAWMLTDQGVQFNAREFSRMLRRRGIRQRFGAVGRKGSIALVERFWRSMKEEYADGLFLWASVRSVEGKLLAFVGWYNRERPHQGLGQRTPEEVHCGMHIGPVRPVSRGRLEVELLAGDHHLPILRLRAAS